QRVEVEPEPDNVAHIAYTSGPTLRPRGVMLTHGRLVQAAEISASGFQQTDRDIVMLFAMPMHHAVGLVVILLTSVSRSSSVIMLPGLSIDGLIEATRKEKATIFMGVPFTHALIVKKAEEEGIRIDLSSLRICASAGAPLPEDIIERFERYLGLRLIQFYGLTEGTAHVTCQALNGIGKLGSVGKALPGWELKIVDDSGQELPSNRPGEIIIKGPIMNGYYNNPQATAEAIRHGWLYTGDIGRIDADGCLFILGLKREMIISKGQNIYPSDIEEVLSSHPAVAEVAVVGIPDRVRGEVVAVAISLKEGVKATEREIKKFCLERIANYKVPKQVIFLDSLPKSGDGKMNKQGLKGYLSAAKAAERGNT
ncbi:MAG: AMP-binding protein, partial [Dehalococcoidales bacterium]